MITNNTCFYKEKSEKYCISLNIPLMKFSADLSLKCIVLEGYFTMFF